MRDNIIPQPKSRRTAFPRASLKKWKSRWISGCTACPTSCDRRCQYAAVARICTRHHAEKGKYVTSWTLWRYPAEWHVISLSWTDLFTLASPSPRASRLTRFEPSSRCAEGFPIPAIHSMGRQCPQRHGGDSVFFCKVRFMTRFQVPDHSAICETPHVGSFFFLVSRNPEPS